MVTTTTASLTERVDLALRKKTRAARERYLAAVRSGDAEEIASAAAQAGVSPIQVAGDVRIIDRAEELTSTVEKLPAAQRLLEDWSKKLAAAEETFQETLKPLQDAINLAAFECQSAQATVKTLRDAVDAALVVWRDNPDLLPPGTEPNVLKSKLAEEQSRQTKENAQRQKLEALQAAKIRHAHAANIVHRIEFGKYPYDVQGFNLDIDQMKRDAPALLAKYKSEVEVSNAEIDKLEAELSATKSN